MSLICRTCGKSYETSDEITNYFFSSASFSQGDHTSPALIAQKGEVILTCPADPREDLDNAMREGDRVQDLEEGESEPDSPGPAPSSVHELGGGHAVSE